MLRLVQVVRGHEDGDALLRHLVDEAPETPPGQRIDSAGGLIEEDHPRAVQHGAGEGEALLPAAGEIAGASRSHSGETRHLDGPLLPFSRGVAAQSVDPSEEPEVVGDGQLVVEAETLAHVTDAAFHAFRVAGDVHAENLRRSRARLEKPAQHADRRGLARTVGAQKSKDLAFRDVERNVVYGAEGAELFGQMFQHDGPGHGGYLASARSRAAAARCCEARASVPSTAARRSATSASRSSEEGIRPSR